MKSLKKQIWSSDYFSSNLMLFCGLVMAILSLAFIGSNLFGGLAVLGAFFKVCGVIIASIVGIIPGIYCFSEFIKTRKKISASNKILEELEEDFCLKDFSLEEYQCKELEKEKDLNPYFLIALWYVNFCNEKGLDYKESIEVTYNTINGMQRASYTDEEIAEYLMTTMGEDRNNELKEKELRKELILIRDIK